LPPNSAEVEQRGGLENELRERNTQKIIENKKRHGKPQQSHVKGTKSSKEERESDFCEKAIDGPEKKKNQGRRWTETERGAITRGKLNTRGKKTTKLEEGGGRS